MKQLMNINGEKKEAIDEHSWREKCSERKMFGSHGFQQKTQSFVAQTGEIGGILFHKFLLFFVCRKGRNKICYIRHIFSVFLKITPKFGRVLLRSLDRMGKVLHRIC